MIKENVGLIALGVAIGVVLALMLARRTTWTEVVRDSEGRIVQIVEMSDIQPILGRRIFNVSDAKRPPIREISEP